MTKRYRTQDILFVHNMKGYNLAGAVNWVNENDFAKQVLTIESYDIGVNVIMKLPHWLAQDLHAEGIIAYDY